MTARQKNQDESLALGDNLPQSGEATGLVGEIRGLEWSGPGQQGFIEADPFVMWMAITFVTIIVILYFFLRGVKKPTHGKETDGNQD